MEEVNPVILTADVEVELQRNKSQLATLLLIYQKVRKRKFGFVKS